MLEIIDEKPITLVEVKKRLEEIEKRTELTTRAKKTKDYLKNFANLSLKEVKELKKKIEDLNIARLKEKQIVKIIDIFPKDLESLKLIFSEEALSIKQEDLKKILAVLKEFKK